jgi:hypothetical protein
MQDRLVDQPTDMGAEGVVTRLSRRRGKRGLPDDELAGTGHPIPQFATPPVP